MFQILITFTLELHYLETRGVSIAQNYSFLDRFRTLDRPVAKMKPVSLKAGEADVGLISKGVFGVKSL